MKTREIRASDSRLLTYDFCLYGNAKTVSLGVDIRIELFKADPDTDSDPDPDY
jgi:hypothetical protein